MDHHPSEELSRSDPTLCTTRSLMLIHIVEVPIVPPMVRFKLRGLALLMSKLVILAERKSHMTAVQGSGVSWCQVPTFKILQLEF